MEGQSNSNASVQTLFTSSWRFSVLGTTLSSVGIFGACTSFLFMTEVLTLTGVVFVPWLALIAAIAFLCISICGVAILRTKGREFFRKAETLVAPQANAGPVPPIMQGVISELQNQIELLNGKNNELEEERRQAELATKVLNFKIANFQIFEDIQSAIASIEGFSENYDNESPKTVKELGDAMTEAISALGALNEAIGRDATGLRESDKTALMDQIQAAIEGLRCADDDIEFNGRWVACGDYIYELGNNRQIQILCASLLDAGDCKLSKIMGIIQKIAKEVESKKTNNDISISASSFMDLFNLSDSQNEKQLSLFIPQMCNWVCLKLQQFSKIQKMESLQEEFTAYAHAVQKFFSGFPRFLFKINKTGFLAGAGKTQTYDSLMDCDFGDVDLLKQKTAAVFIVVEQKGLNARPSGSTLGSRPGTSVKEVLLAATEEVVERGKKFRELLTQKDVERTNSPLAVIERPAPPGVEGGSARP